MSPLVIPASKVPEKNIVVQSAASLLSNASAAVANASLITAAALARAAEQLRLLEAAVGEAVEPLADGLGESSVR